jgi:hypothetical protein
MGWQTAPIGLQVLGRGRALLILALAGVLAGCAGGMGPAQGPMAAMTSVSGGAQTVAFDSIDGPPPAVFDRFVQILTTESQSRNVTIVSRDSAAGYRIRGYFAATIHSGRTSIAWVWDVYDRNQQRVLRLNGEEIGGKPGRDAWAVADDQMLRRIAQSGLIRLSGFVNGTAPPDLPDTQSPGPAIASLSSDTAGGSGTGALSFSVR